MFWAYVCVLVAFIVIIVTFYLLSPLLTPPTIDIKNAHIVITGGSSGIGKAIAEEAVLKGAKVTLIARNKNKLEEAKESITSSVNPAVVYTSSVDLCGEYKLVEKALLEAEACLGPIDVLINCAGSAIPGRFDETSINDFKKMIELNFMSSVKTTKAVIPGMKARGRGRIVFISSQAGQLGVYGYTAYSGSKFALKGLAEALQMEMKPYNIYVTLSFPPDTDTPGLQEENKHKPKETALISETSALIDPNYVAQTILQDCKRGRFLSSVGMDGWMLSTLTCGFAPVTSIMEAIQQIMCMGVVRIVSLVCLFQFNRIVHKCKEEKNGNARMDSKKSL